LSTGPCKTFYSGEAENVKAEYLERIEKNVKKYDIPYELIINWDQTGL